MQDGFQLFALGEVIGYHLQLILQTLNLFAHPADLVVQFLPANEVIGVHIHIFLPGLLEFGKLGGQLLFVVQVFIFRLIYPLELMGDIADDIFLCFEHPSEVFLQNLDQFILVHRHCIRAVVGTTPIVTGADPAHIGVLIGADSTPEGPAALFALNESGEQVFVALPLLVHLESLSTGLHDLLCLLKGFRVDDAKIWPLHHHPVCFILVGSLAGEKIGDFLFAVDDFSGIEFVGEDTADTVLAPPAVPFGFKTPLVEEIGNFCCAVTVLNIPLINLADNGGFFLVNGQVEVVANRLVIPIDDVGNTSLFCVHLLAELHSLGGVGAFFLRQRTEDGQDKLAVAHTGHVSRQELRFDSQRLEFADILQKVNRVPGKTGDILDHHHIKKAVLRICHHSQKFLAVFDFGTGDALVGIQAHKVVSGTLRIFRKKGFLCLQTIKLIFLVGGHPAVSGDVHGRPPGYICIVLLHLYYITESVNVNREKHPVCFTQGALAVLPQSVCRRFAGWPVPLLMCWLRSILSADNWQLFLLCLGHGTDNSVFAFSW